MINLDRKATVCLLLFAALLTAERGVAQSVPIPDKILAYPDMIVLNGKIATMDQVTTTVQALAIRDGRILARGTNNDIEKLAGPRTHRIDARGRTVIPGLVDAHEHPPLWLMEHLGWDERLFALDPQLKLTLVAGNSTVELHKAVDETIRKRVTELGPGKWVLLKLPRNEAGQSVLQQGVRDVQSLDFAAPDNPVLVAFDYQNVALNTKGREIFQSKYGKLLSSFSPWYFLIFDTILARNTRAVEQMLRYEMAEYTREGITTIGGNIEPLEVFQALNKMDVRHDMPMRYAWVHRTGYSIAKDPAEFYRLFPNLAGLGSEYLWNVGTGAENWEDRGSACSTMVPKKKEDAAAEAEACAKHRPGTVTYNAHLATLEAGLRMVNVHAVRDGTLDILLGMVDQAVRNGALTVEQVRERRLYFDHGQLIRPDQIPLLKKYNIGMTFQPSQLSGGPEIERVYGSEYLKWLFPCKSLLDAGVPFVVSTDQHMIATPEELALSAKPWFGVWPVIEAFITREWGGRVWGPDQKLDRVEALRGITTRGAWLLLREKELGSLEEGKLADFVILDKDYFTIPEHDIHTIKSVLTVVGGKILHGNAGAAN